MVVDISDKQIVLSFYLNATDLVEQFVTLLFIPEVHRESTTEM